MLYFNFLQVPWKFTFVNSLASARVKRIWPFQCRFEDDPRHKNRVSDRMLRTNWDLLKMIKTKNVRGQPYTNQNYHGFYGNNAKLITFGSRLICFAFVSSTTLGDFLKESVDTCAPGISRLLSIMLDVIKAIEHLHKIGICHNDITPSNVLICFNEGVSWISYQSTGQYEITLPTQCSWFTS